MRLFTVDAPMDPATLAKDLHFRSSMAPIPPSFRLCLAALRLAVVAAGLPAVSSCDSPECHGAFPRWEVGATTERLYVCSSAPAGGDGSEAMPYRTIAEAVEAANALPRPAAIAIAPGEYRGERRLDIRRSMALIGSSHPAEPPAVTLVSKFEDDNPATMVVFNGDPGAPDVHVVVQGIEIPEARESGIQVVGPNASVHLAGFRLLSTTPPPTTPEAGGSYTYGLLVASGATVELERSTIQGSDYGIYAKGVSDEPLVSFATPQVILRRSNLRGNFSAGLLLVSADGALFDSMVEDNSNCGILVLSSNLRVVRTEIRHTLALGDGGPADGVFAALLTNDAGDLAQGASDTTVEISDSVIGDNERAGVVISSLPLGAKNDFSKGDCTLPAHVHATMTGSRVKNNGTKVLSGGIVIQNCAGRTGSLGAWSEGVELVDNDISENVGTGVLLLNGGRAIVRRNLIRGTVAEPSVGIADGIELLHGASADIADNTFASNARVGVMIDTPAPLVTAGSRVVGNDMDESGEYSIVFQDDDWNFDEVFVDERSAVHEIKDPDDLLEIVSGEQATPGLECNSDGIRDTGEQCDRSDLHDESCSSLGFPGGTLGCTKGCTFDVSACCTDDAACTCGPGSSDLFQVVEDQCPSYGPLGCSGDGSLMLKGCGEMISPTVLRVRVRKADDSTFNQDATLRLFVGAGPTCPNPPNVVKLTKPVQVGAVEQTMDLTVNPYDGSWDFGELKAFWVGKDEAGLSSFRATSTVTVKRSCVP